MIAFQSLAAVVLASLNHVGHSVKAISSDVFSIESDAFTCASLSCFVYVGAFERLRWPYLPKVIHALGLCVAVKQHPDLRVLFSC